MADVDVERVCSVEGCGNWFVIPAHTPRRQPTRCQDHRTVNPDRSKAALATAPAPAPRERPVVPFVTDLTRIDRMAQALTPSRAEFRAAADRVRSAPTPDAYERLAAVALAAARILRRRAPAA